MINMTQSVKGLSQILYLIIAAAVLMFVGLIMISAFQGGIIGTGGQADAQACQNAVASCQVDGVDSVPAPPSCYDSDGDLIAGAPSGMPKDQSGEYTCP
jgi:hypothetical protein